MFRKSYNLNNLKIDQDYDDNQDHVFINYTLVNQNISRYGSTLAKIIDNRSVPIINNPDKYNVTIARFGIPSEDTPLMIYPLGFIPGTNLNYFVVTLSYLGNNYTVTAVPVVQDYQANVYVYYVQQYLDSLNNAFQQAWVLLNNDHPGIVNEAPKYVYDQSTSLISLMCEIPYATSNIEIWVSTEIGERITGIYSFFNGYYNNDYKDFRFFVNDYGNNIIDYNGVPYIRLRQEGIQLGNLMDLQSLVFISNLPTQSENTGIGITTSESGVNLQPGNSQLQILLDFEPIQGSSLITTISAQRFQYQPSLYRLVPLLGSAPIVNIYLQIFYQDGLGNLVPITVPPSSSFNVKLLFLKKGLSA